MEAINRGNCLINYRFGNIHGPINKISEDISGANLTELPEGIVEVIEVKMAGSHREVFLLPQKRRNWAL